MKAEGTQLLVILRFQLFFFFFSGDLLYKISGVTGKMTTETAGDDDNFGTEQSQRAITHVLGVERRNRVLSGLYMGRSDVALMVRQASLHVWKVRPSRQGTAMF
jgi:hypothetical protein